MRNKAQTYTLHIYGAVREVVAAERVVMLKTLRCPVRVVWVYRRTQWVALMSTDLDLSIEQIIEYYSARWKIEICQSWYLRKSLIRCSGVMPVARSGHVWPMAGVRCATHATARALPYRPTAATRYALHGGLDGREPGLF